jgi:hypothetical protein
MAAWQAWLLLAAAAAIAVAVFLLKLRPPRVIVASTLIWRRVLDESRELTVWERIRRAVSLIVTIAIALALALAVTRPRRVEGAADVASGRLLLVLDSSWSMQGRTRAGETRWERGVAEARRLLAAASGSQIALASTADGIVEGPTTDTALIETALERVSPGGTHGSAWPRLAGAAAVHFITDGATPRPLESSIVVHSVFEAAPNAAITAFEIRPSLDAATAGDAYLEIANYAPSPQRIHLTLTRGSSTIFDRQFDFAAGETLRQVLPIPRGGDPALRARVRAGANALDADDEAVAWAERSRPLHVTVVGTETQWLRTALAANPDVRATFVAPAAYQAPGGASAALHLVIFDKWAPPDAPKQPALLFAPPVDTSWLAVDASRGQSAVVPVQDDERRPRWETPGTHRVVAGVDPLTLTIERAHRYGSPLLTPIARSSRGTPLVSVQESTSARLVVVAFGGAESNLAAAPGFPVLLGNAIDWLARPAARPAASRHESGALPPGLVDFDRGVSSVLGPAGDRVALTTVNDRVLGLLRAPGLYTLEGGGARSTIAVNAGDPQLSNLMRTTPSISAKARAVGAGTSGHPWWLYCAVAAFALALIEWWTWQRRITV